jgi:hypothetical protein
VPKPVSPKKTIIGLLGLMAGGTGGVMMALLLELLSTGKTSKTGNRRPVDDLEYEVLENNEFLTSTHSSLGVEVLDSANG